MASELRNSNVVLKKKSTTLGNFFQCCVQPRLKTTLEKKKNSDVVQHQEKFKFEIVNSDSDGGCGGYKT